MSKAGLIILSTVTVLSFAPVLGPLASGAMAGWLGCQLDEGSSHRCLAGGIDIGDDLYTAWVLGWLMLVTWPGMLASLAVWTWLLLRRLLKAADPGPR